MLATLPDRKRSHIELIVCGYEVSIVVNRRVMDIVGIFRPVDLLFDGRMIAEAVQSGGG